MTIPVQLEKGHRTIPSEKTRRTDKAKKRRKMAPRHCRENVFVSTWIYQD